MFGCDGLGAIAPLEYCGTNVVHYQHSLAKVLAAPGFVAEYTQALLSLGACGLLGLALLPPASECALRGEQWLLEEGGSARSLLTTAYAAGQLPADATVLDGSHDVVWVAPASMDRDSFAVQRVCNVRNTKCRDKATAEGYATQRVCSSVRNTRHRDKE